MSRHDPSPSPHAPYIAAYNQSKRGSSGGAQTIGPQPAQSSAPKIPEPLTDSLKDKKDNSVKLVDLFNSVELEKDYGKYSLAFDGRKIRKHVPGVRDRPEPSEEEVQRFITDINRAASSDQAVAGYLKTNPLPEPAWTAPQAKKR